MSRSILHLLAALVVCLPLSGVLASPGKEEGDAGQQSLGINETFGRWQDGVVEWRYNPTGAPPYYSNSAYFVGLLQQAMDEIEDVAGVDFQYLGEDSNSVLTDYSDFVVTIGWDNLAGFAGVASPQWVSCPGPEITSLGYCRYKDGSIIFNNDIGDIDWDDGDVEASERKLLQTALHEYLHLLGLGHSDEPVSIMYANPYTNLSQLRADDIDGLQSLYGPSTSPADPVQYVLLPDNVGPVVQNSYLADDDAIQTPLTSIDDTETADWIGLTWEEQQNAHSPIHIVMTGPEGYFFSKRVEDRNCGVAPPSYCIYWYSVASMETLRTFPGTWQVHLIVDGDLEATHTLDNQFTAPVINEAPDAEISFDVVAGVAPLTVNATLTINGDNEGDNVSAMFHVPTEGEQSVDFGTSPGQFTEQVTLTADGEYEIYVEVTDDGSRYGTPWTGTEAGAGFRKVFRQVISVGPQHAPLQRVVGLPNVGGGAGPELGVVLEGSINGYVNDAGNGALIGTQVYNGSRDPLDIGVVDNNGSPALAVLAEDANGRAWVESRDAVTGTLVRDVWFSTGYTPLAMTVLPDMNGNNTSEVAVLMTRPSDNNRAWVHIKDGVTLQYINNVWFEAGYTPHDLEYVPNVDANPGPELAVLMTRDSDNDRAWVHLKDAQSSAYVRNVWFQAGYTPKDLAIIDNLDGNPGSEVAVLMQRDSDSRTWVHMKDALSGNFVKNTWFDAGYTPMRLEILPDLDANPGDDLAVLTTRDSDGRAWVLVRDALSGAFIRNVWFQGDFAPSDFAVLPEMDGNPGAELAVLGERGSGQVQVEIKDAGTISPVNVVNFP